MATLAVAQLLGSSTSQAWACCYNLFVSRVCSVAANLYDDVKKIRKTQQISIFHVRLQLQGLAINSENTFLEKKPLGACAGVNLELDWNFWVGGAASKKIDAFWSVVLEEKVLGITHFDTSTKCSVRVLWIVGVWGANLDYAAFLPICFCNIKSYHKWGRTPKNVHFANRCSLAQIVRENVLSLHCRKLATTEELLLATDKRKASSFPPHLSCWYWNAKRKQQSKPGNTTFSVIFSQWLVQRFLSWFSIARTHRGGP